MLAAGTRRGPRSPLEKLCDQRGGSARRVKNRCEGVGKTVAWVQSRGEKNWRWDGRAAPIALAEELFSVCQVPVKQFMLTRGPQSEICEVGMEAKLSEECFSCHGSL